MLPHNDAVQTSLSQRTIHMLVALIGVLALAARMWGISFGLPGIDHGDESEVVNHAVRFGSGDLNPHRFQYGSLVQYLLFVIYACYYGLCFITGKIESVHQFAVQFVRDPSPFYLIARSVSACFGAATVWITYEVGKKVKGDGTGLVAALLLACCYQHVIHSHYATVDAAVAFFFMAAVSASLALLHDQRISRYVIAGLMTGLAVATKFNGVIAFVAFAAAHVSGRTGTGLKGLFSGAWWLGCVACVGGHFLASPYFYVDFNAAWKDIHALRIFHAGSSFTLWQYLKNIMGEYWGIPAGILCVAALVRYLATRNADLGVIAVTATSIILFASLHRYVEAKYVICAFPLLAVLGAALIMESTARIRRSWRSWIRLLMLSLLLVHPLHLILQWDAERGRKSITLESKQWIERHIPAGSKILLDTAGNAGPKLANHPRNIKRQYERARMHNLLKAELLQLQLEIEPQVYYDIVEIDEPAGSRRDDYEQLKLWLDTDVIGQPAAYYCERGYDYIIVTQRYFARMDQALVVIKDFVRGQKGIRIYRVRCD